MRFTVEIKCSSQYFRYYVIDTNLYRKLISCRDNDVCLYDFWEEYEDSMKESCKTNEQCLHWVVGDFVLVVKDEQGNEIYQTENVEDIPIRKVYEPKFLISKGIVFACDYELQHSAKFSFKANSFDVRKLYFANCQYDSGPYSDDLTIVENIRYDGARDEFYIDIESELYREAPYVGKFNERQYDFQFLDLDELEDYTTYIVKEK